MVDPLRLSVVKLRTHMVGFAHVILSEAVYAIRAINILVSDWDITRGIACARIYDRERHRQKL